MSKYQSASLSFVPRSSKVKPTHNKRQYTNTPASSSVNPWTTSIDSSDLQILSLRTQVMPNDRNQQKWPIVVKGRVDRSTSISSSIVGTSAIIGGKTKCPMVLIIAFGIPIILFLLAVNIYLVISITSATKTCITTADPINWPLIGTIIGLLCLAALTACCCVYWRYCCPLCGEYACEGNIELYHIERCMDPNCYWIHNENDNYTNLKMRLEENIDPGKPLPGVSVSKVKRDRIALDEGNPGIKPPNRQTDEEENIVSLLKPENNKICIRQRIAEMNNGIHICIRQRIAEMNNGIQVIRVRSQPPLITHHTSISDRCPSIIVNTIYLNNYDEIKPVSNALDIDQMNNSSSSQQPILLNETELTQDSPKPNSANNNSKILSLLTRTERIPRKIKPYKIYCEPISGIPKDKNKNRPRVKHVPRQNLL